MKRTALYHRHRALGARMGVAAGWECAESFGSVEEEVRRARSSVAVADLSPLGKLLVRGAGVGAWIARSGGAAEVGGVVPWGDVPGTRLCRLTDEDALMLALPAETARVAEGLAESGASEGGGSCLHLVDLTSGRAGIGLVGPRSADLLVNLTALDLSDERLPDGRCAQTGLARVPVTIVRQDAGGGALPAYEIYVARDLGEYVWDAVFDAAPELGARPCGWAAYTQLHAAGVGAA